MVSLRGDELRAPELLPAMGRSLRHRGPDGRGLFQRPAVGIGSERLRIIDLREEADQPFTDPATGCCLVCNGEIYNAGELRRRYAGYPYRSHSDVEPILPLYLDKGADGLSDLDGMFGLAIWDPRSRTLTLMRDRAGEKPLFYSRTGGELWFASEVQALLLDPEVSRELDETAIYQYLALGYVPEPRTTFRDVRKIEAGTVVELSAGGERVTRYWRPEAIEVRPQSEASALSRLHALLQASVRKQTVSDVPIGVFLSGGLDSSLLTALTAREASGRPLHTFNARFAEASYDESSWAAECARRLGTEHHEVIVDEDSLLTALRAVIEGLAEPLADPAILPTWLIAREARKHVTVVLSGEGADELFGGYPTYLGHELVRPLQALPEFGRRGLRRVAGLLPASRGKVTFEFLLKRFLADAERPWLDRHLAWFGTGAQGVLAAGRGPGPGAPIVDLEVERSGGVGAAMLVDYKTYLPDDLLTKNDRATMLHSLEARAPFLDRDLSAFALGLPESLKVRRLTTKWLLKKAAHEWVPGRARRRRKRGLSVPVASWVDRGLRTEVDRLLDPARLARQGLFDPARTQALLAEHRAGAANHARPLWAMTVLQLWLERWVPE